MTDQELELKKQEFLAIWDAYVKRPGAERLRSYLLEPQNDFFTAPASTRYHGAYAGGLVEHSLNVYHNLKAYLSRERVHDTFHFPEYSEESIAVCALLHDLCKMNFYTVDFRNAKNAQGVWEKVPYYKIDDRLPYGHGEKSVLMIQFFMHLHREEAMAIRWHMGFSGTEDKNTIGAALERFPLAFALYVADMEASYFLEGSE